MEINIGADADQAFHRIAEAAEKLLPLLLEDEQKQVQNSTELLRRKVIPLIHHECPLLVAVTGGGSVGKSTLFNMLAGGKFSGVKSKAGYTRRTLAAIHPSVARSEDRMSLLFELFRKNAHPVPLKSPDEMLEPGDPLYVESNSISESMAVLDTPDFDTGSIDEFANRAAAEEILAASDVLVYLFTNQTYNNKANTDFVRNAISGIGRRKVVLVYRCSAAYPDEEVGEHMDEVLRNLFPDSPNPRSEALGLYRVDESDAVVKGTADPIIRPFADGMDIMSLINGLNIVDIRKDNLISQCEAIVREMKNALDKVSMRRSELVAYRDAVRVLCGHAVANGLAHFPQGLLMEKFIERWREAQPRAVRIAHGFGRVGRKVYDGVKDGIKWVSGKFKSGVAHGGEMGSKTFEETLRIDFEDCAGKLRAELNQPVLRVEVPLKNKDVDMLRDTVEKLASQREGEYGCSKDGKDMAVCTVSRPTALVGKVGDMLKDMTIAGDDGWIEEAVKISCRTQDVDKDIKVLVDEARKDMGFREKSKEHLWAVVATLPPIAAVTWTLCTYDPVVGTGAVAHIAALFGLNDLCATIAIPASLGLDAVHKAFLKNNLERLYNVWFSRKMGPIYNLIETNITSICTNPCDELLNKTAEPFNRLQEAIKAFDDIGATKKENAL